MKEIQLSQGKVALVSDEDCEWLSQFKWCAHKSPHNFYATRNVRLDDGRQSIVSMHRAILQAPKGMCVDHRDGDGLNNQRDNIRLCTNQENLRNTRPYQNTSSQFKGVYWHISRRKWVAAIKVNGKQRHLGYFVDQEEAASAYDAAARTYFGEFARTNFD